MRFRVNGQLVGSATVNSLGTARIRRTGNAIPAVSTGSTIRVRKLSGVLVASQAAFPRPRHAAHSGASSMGGPGVATHSYSVPSSFLTSVNGAGRRVEPLVVAAGWVFSVVA